MSNLQFIKDEIQILLRSFAAPLLLAVVLFAITGYKMSSFQIFIQVVLVTSLVVLRLLSNERYLLTCILHDDKVAITYRTQFLQVRSIEFPFLEISDVRLSKRLGVDVIWCPVLSLKAKNEGLKFSWLQRRCTTPFSSMWIRLTHRLVPNVAMQTAFCCLQEKLLKKATTVMCLRAEGGACHL